MKNILTNITALLLVLWYSLSVIGFDVHTCSTSGESYIATVIGGTACEDIHPEHQPKKCSCCHHGQDGRHDSESSCHELSTRPCCTDDWQMMSLTGCKTFQEQDEFAALNVVMFPLSSHAHSGNIHSYIDCSGLRAFCKPDSGPLVPLDFLRIYGIWRI